MVSCDTCLLTLALVSAFLVVSMDARSWDLAVTIGQQIDFFSRNGTPTGHSKIADAVNLKGLAYDSSTRTMYMSVIKNDNVSIYSNNLNEKNPKPHALLKNSSSHITAIVFDPITRTLFWTDSVLQALMKMEVPLDGAPGNPTLLHDLKGYIPYGIALDICNRYIYWTNGNSTVHSIERSKLDGSERSVIVKDNLYEVYGLAIDHEEGKLYWTDDEEGIYYKIERSALDGKDREILMNGKHHQPVYIAVDKNSVYWSDWTSRAVWKINKTKSAENVPVEFVSYYKSYVSGPVMSIITRDNVGDIDCEDILKRQRNKSNSPTISPIPSIESYNNLTTSTEELNSTIQVQINCLNKGLYNPLTASCQCKKGFTGVFCEISLCHNYCIHGRCVIDDKNSPRCVCSGSYSGARCEQDMCNGYCLNNGTCLISDGKPTCECGDYMGSRCEYSNELDQLCSLYCVRTEKTPDSLSLSFCRCSELNETFPEHFFSTEPLVSSTIISSVLGTVIGVLVVVVGVLSYHINKLRRRPRIRKRFVVSKGGVTPLTSRPQVPSDSCEITIENCCNMNICETPCFEPKIRTTPTSSTTGNKKSEEKNSLLDSMEGADSC